MIPTATKIEIFKELPSDTIDGRTIQKVMESFSLNEYTSPVLGINYLDEWRVYYNSIDKFWNIVDEDSFEFSTYYSTRIRFTAAADDATITKTSNVTIIQGTYEYELEPLLDITGISTSDEYSINTTNDGIVFTTLPTDETVAVTFTCISRGYSVAHSIIEQAIEWMELHFGDLTKSVNGFIVNRSSLVDLSAVIGSELLTVLTYEFMVACKKTFVKEVPDEFVGVDEITIVVDLKEEE